MDGGGCGGGGRMSVSGGTTGAEGTDMAGEAVSSGLSEKDNSTDDRSSSGKVFPSGDIQPHATARAANAACSRSAQRDAKTTRAAVRITPPRRISRPPGS